MRRRNGSVSPEVESGGGEGVGVDEFILFLLSL